MVAFADLLNPAVGGFSPRPTLTHVAHRAGTASNPLTISTHHISSEAIHSHTSPLRSPPPSSSSSSSSPGPTDDSPSVSMLMLLEMEDHPPRKVQFHLFQDQVPNTCNFFRALSAPGLGTSIVLTTATDRLVTFNLPPPTTLTPATVSRYRASAALELPGLTGESDEMRIDVDYDRAWMVGLTKTASGGAQVVIHLSAPFDTPLALSTLPLPLPPPSPPTTLTTELVYFARVIDTASQQVLLAAHHAAQQQLHSVHITTFEIATPPPDTFIERSCLNSQRSESPTMSKMTADSPTSEDLSTSETSRASATPSSSGRSSSSVGTEKRGRPWGDSWMTVEDLERQRVTLAAARKRKVLVRRKKAVNTSPTSINHPVVNPPVGERRWGPSWTDGAAVAEEEELVVEWVDVGEDTSQQQQVQQRPEGAVLQLAPISPPVKQEGQTPMPPSPVAQSAILNTLAVKTVAEDEEARATKRRKWSIDAEPSNVPVQTSTLQYPMPDPIFPHKPASSLTTGSISPRDVGASQLRTLAAERVSIRGLLSGGRDGPLPDLNFRRLSAPSTCAPTHSPSRFNSKASGSGATSWGSFIASNNPLPPVRKPSISTPQVPLSLPTYPQRSTNDSHLSRDSSTKVTGPSRISCLGSAVYPQFVPNRHGTIRDRPASSRSSTSTSRTSHGQEPVYQQQQYDYPHRNRYEHQFQVSLCPTPHEEMEQMRISTTGEDGGLRIEQYNPYEYGGRRQRRRNTTAGQETPVASASGPTHTQRPSGSAQQQLAYSSQAQAESVQAALPIPQPLIYLPPSSPEASNSRQPLNRKRKHEALAVPLAAR